VQFDYRRSNLGRYIVLSANFKLIKKDKQTIKKKINKYISYRQKTQDLTWPSAGCFFKNPSLNKTRIRSNPRLKGLSLKSELRLNSGLMDSKTQPSAAYFIERCGLKGSSIGDAAVSSKHANYIINKGNASFTDTLRLMTYITRTVKRRFNLDLEPEIKIWKQI
jgi:UDP-N-acetylmuramate dehydrogenase